MPQREPLERSVCLFTHNFCLFPSFTFFLLLSVVLKATPASISLVNWVSIGKLISVTCENWILNQSTLSHVRVSCNYMCITKQPTQQTWNKTATVLFSVSAVQFIFSPVFYSLTCLILNKFPKNLSLVHPIEQMDLYIHVSQGNFSHDFGSQACNVLTY